MKRCRRFGKIRYPNEHAARVALVGIAIARNCGKARRREIRPYLCTACMSWHLTSKPISAPKEPS